LFGFKHKDRPMRIIFVLPLFLAASACATAPPVPPLAGECQSEALGQFVGKQASAQLGGDMLRVSRAKILRWVPLGGMVTMDFSPERLTVQLDGSNRVQSANCG
jgi:hypothetical protein